MIKVFLFLRKVYRAISPFYTTVSIDCDNPTWLLLEQQAKKENKLVDEVIEEYLKQYIKENKNV